MFVDPNPSVDLGTRLSAKVGDDGWRAGNELNFYSSNICAAESS